MVERYEVEGLEYPPKFKENSGQGHMVNVRDHNGTIFFGEEQSLFETNWDEAFRAYRVGGGINAVAVLDSQKSLDSLTEADVVDLNYTNGNRFAVIGKVIVYRRFDGRYLAIAPIQQEVKGPEEAILTFNYQIIPSDAELSQTSDQRGGLIDARGETLYLDDGFVSGGALLGGAPLNSGPLNGEAIVGNAIGEADQVTDLSAFSLYAPFTPQALPDAARAMRERLEELLRSSDQFEPERLSNNPPPEIILNHEARQEALDALDALSKIDAADTGTPELLRKIGRIILKAAGQVLRWTGGKIDKVIDAALETGAQEGMRLFVTSSLITHAWNTAGTDLMQLGMSALKAVGG